MKVCRKELERGFRELGLDSGSKVVVHSSLSSFGRVEGGAETVVDALLNVVRPSGTVVAPTFTRYDEPYDPNRSPSTTGAVTEALRRHEKAVRSPHPTKSIVAIGPDVSGLVADHEPANSLGPGSPLHRLLEDGGKVLLLGVDHTANSAIHIAERLAGVPYRDQMARVRTCVGDTMRTVEVNRVHCSRGFEVVSPLCEQAGIVSHGRIGGANARLFDGTGLLSVVIELLEAEPGALLCSVPDCKRCQYARERLAEHNR